MVVELSPDDSSESVAEAIIENERLLSSNKLKMITDMIEKIQSKLREETDHKFHLVRNIKVSFENLPKPHVFQKGASFTNHKRGFQQARLKVRDCVLRSNM